MIDLDNDVLLKNIGYECPEKDGYISSPVSTSLLTFLKEKKVSKILLDLWEKDSGIFLCGGILRAFFAGEEVNDVDVYFEDLETFDRTHWAFVKAGIEKVASTERAITYKGDGPPIQLVRFIHGPLEEIVAGFDFTIVKCGASNSVLYRHASHGIDIERKELRYCGSTLPLSSLYRAFKYAKKGYHLSALDLVVIVKDITATVDLEDRNSVLYHIQSFDPSLIERMEIGIE